LLAPAAVKQVGFHRALRIDDAAAVTRKKNVVLPVE
jgi:hypothetical protein